MWRICSEGLLGFDPICPNRSAGLGAEVFYCRGIFTFGIPESELETSSFDTENLRVVSGGNCCHDRI